jgi:HTH-type transcriptional regulator/antitoxin HipB
MWRMKDTIRLPVDLGAAVQKARKNGKFRATHIATRSGRARNVLYRLERGEDVTVGSLLDILRAMGLTIRLERLGMPTLADVQQRFAQDDDDAS